mgnify:FL=1|jgi:hypothetical protein
MRVAYDMLHAFLCYLRLPRRPVCDVEVRRCRVLEPLWPRALWAFAFVD